MLCSCVFVARVQGCAGGVPVVPRLLLRTASCRFQCTALLSPQHEHRAVHTCFPCGRFVLLMDPILGTGRSAARAIQVGGRVPVVGKPDCRAAAGRGEGQAGRQQAALLSATDR